MEYNIATEHILIETDLSNTYQIKTSSFFLKISVISLHKEEWKRKPTISEHRRKKRIVWLFDLIVF